MPCSRDIALDAAIVMLFYEISDEQRCTRCGKIK